MTKRIKKSLSVIPEIINYLQSGEVIILHTDMVYIFLASGLNPQAMNKIHKLKKWNPCKPLVLLTNYRKASEYITISQDVEKLMRLFPYPINLIVPHRHNLREELTMGHPTVFISCPDEFISTLVEDSPIPIVCGTASFGEDYRAKQANVAELLFGEDVPLIVDGGKSKHEGQRTTLIDCSLPLPTIMNFGVISYDDLRPILPHIELPSHLRK